MLDFEGRCLIGSSPLTRGKRGGDRGGLRLGRLIPAHAGKTVSCPSRRARGRAHPRSRGENRFREDVGAGAVGSSPLTRGKLTLDLEPELLPRLIPAHAGKTRESGSAHTNRWAHPRSRGENGRSTRGEAICSGSSPLTRGKPISPPRWSSETRLIPAHAGKTTPHTDHTLHTRAHPRSRGENQLVMSWAIHVIGSSPLTRGKRLFGIPPAKLAGLIPAHAGKTMARLAPYASRAAHPRSRGENRGERV